MTTEISWRVEERDTGTLCASGSAPTKVAAMHMMYHYAMQLEAMVPPEPTQGALL